MSRFRTAFSYNKVKLCSFNLCSNAPQVSLQVNNFWSFCCWKNQPGFLDSAEFFRSVLLFLLPRIHGVIITHALWLTLGPSENSYYIRWISVSDQIKFQSKVWGWII